MKAYIERDEWYPVYTLNEERMWDGELEVEVSEAQFLAIRDAEAAFRAAQRELFDLWSEARDGRR